MQSDKLNSSHMLDISDQYIKPPDPKNLKRNSSPEEYLQRLNQISTPSERLIALAQSCSFSTPTHEGKWLMQTSIGSFAAGFLWGALCRSQGVHAEYIRKHNASVFDNKYRAQRHFWDTLVSGVVPRGLKYAVKTCLFTTSAASVVIASITCRGQLYAPDWIIGLTSIGALSRLWLGPRAMAVGGLFGVAASTIGIGTAKLFESVSGKTVGQMCVINHEEYSTRREARLRRLQIASEESHKRLLGEEMDSFRFDIDG